jgi:hypothetical protein
MSEMIEWPKYTIQYLHGADRFHAATSVRGTELRVYRDTPITAVHALRLKALSFTEYGEPLLMTYEQPDLTYKGSE